MRIPVIVVSGFLGSGKTTFLRYLIKNTNKKFGLLINEFGEVGIDGDLIKNCNKCQDKGSEAVIELNNGCLCCTVQDDFVPAIKTLLKLNTGIEVIIIETSGLALPIPLLKALNWPEIRTFIYLDLVVGLVNGETMLNGSPIYDLTEINNQFEQTKIIEHNSSINELFEEQLQVADVVLISRSDLLNEKEFFFIKEKIQEKIGIEVPVLKSINGKINLEFIFNSNIDKRDFNEFMSEDNDHDDHDHLEIFSESYKSDYFLDKQEFEMEMTKILNSINILRIKGRLWIPDKILPLQIQIVGKKINTWYEEASSDCLRRIKKSGIELIMIGFEKESFEKIKSKIKEKFKILNDPKSVN